MRCCSSLAMVIVSVWISSSASSLVAFYFSLAIRPCRDLEAALDACSNKLCASTEFALISFPMDSTNGGIVCCLVSSNSLHIFLFAIFTHWWNRLSKSVQHYSWHKTYDLYSLTEPLLNKCTIQQ